VFLLLLPRKRRCGSNVGALAAALAAVLPLRQLSELLESVTSPRPPRRCSAAVAPAPVV